MLQENHFSQSWCDAYFCERLVGWLKNSIFIAFFVKSLVKSLILGDFAEINEFAGEGVNHHI